jgi:phosphoribosylamine-glycine ligase
VGADVARARRLAYEGAARVHWPGMIVRTDIAAAAARQMEPTT